MTQKYPGQGFNEYALIIGLVVVVSVVGLGAVGMNLNQIFSNMITMEEPAPPSTPSLASSSPSETVSGPAAPIFIGPLPAEPICFDGMCVNLPIVSAENGVVDTTGGNGAEHIQSFSNVLEQMAIQLDLAGADPALVQLISNLALRGHNLGDAQATVQNKALGPSGGGGISMGKRHADDYKKAQSKFNNQYQQLTQYLAAHPEALPETSQFIVDLQVSQINTLSQAVTASAGAKSGPKPTVNNGSAGLIHQSADTICDQGGKNCRRGNSTAQNTPAEEGQS
jgi:hypothetical protein